MHDTFRSLISVENKHTPCAVWLNYRTNEVTLLSVDQSSFLATQPEGAT